MPATRVVLLTGDEIGPPISSAAVRILDAIRRTLADGVKTHDLGGTASTTAYTKAVASRLQ